MKSIYLVKCENTGETIYVGDYLNDAMRVIKLKQSRDCTVYWYNSLLDKYEIWFRYRSI